MRDVAAELAATPVFARSPTLSRLLRYLVEQTILGNGDRLKSYTIGVEGLGREPDSDNPDAYARVQVNRLRKALDTVYAQHGGGGKRLMLDPGSYRVRLVSPAESSLVPDFVLSGEGHPDRLAALRFLRGRRQAIGLFVILLAASLAVFALIVAEQQSRARFAKLNFPYVSVSLQSDDGRPLPPGTGASIKRELLSAIARYDGIRARSMDADPAGYSLVVSLDRVAPRTGGDLALIDMRTQRLVWSSQVAEFALDEDGISNMAQETAFAVSGATGALHTYSRRVGVEEGTPYACWLRFTADIEKLTTIGDNQLETCAREWYAVAPHHPVAAALYGWTLTDRSVMAWSERSRQQRLDEAIAVIDQARLLNPGTVVLQLAAQRAHSFAGNRAQMRDASNRALAINPHSPDVTASVGLMLTLWNDPRGIELSRRAFAQRSNPPPMYFLAPAIDAMMRDDTRTMAANLEQLDELRDQTLIVLLVAAYEARTGHAKAAAQRLDRRPLSNLFGGPDLQTVIARLPVSPAIRARLRTWLAPVTHPSAAAAR